MSFQLKRNISTVNPFCQVFILSKLFFKLLHLRKLMWSWSHLRRMSVCELRVDVTSLSQQARVRASWSSPRSSRPPSETSWVHLAWRDNNHTISTPHQRIRQVKRALKLDRWEYLQEVSQHLRHTDLQRLQTAAATWRDEGEVCLYGGQTLLKLGVQVTSMDVHHQERLAVIFWRQAGAPHLQRWHQTGSHMTSSRGTTSQQDKVEKLIQRGKKKSRFCVTITEKLSQITLYSITHVFPHHSC